MEINKSQSYSTIDRLMLCNSVKSMDNCIEIGSACFLETNMMFFIENSSLLSVAKSVSYPLKFTDKELESPSLHQQMECLPQSLIKLPQLDNICPTDDIGSNECRNIEETEQEGRGETIIFSDFIYDVECKEKCEESLFVMNDGEASKKQPGPCLLSNCVDLGVCRRLVSFEIQFGWDRLQSLRLGYGSNWNHCTGRSEWNSDFISKYPVLDINVTKVMDRSKRTLLKLLSLQEDVVSSVDIALNVGLSSICTVTDNSTVSLWDIEFGKCLNKMMADDYTSVGSHIENSPGFLLSSIMIRKEKASLFLWDPRHFFKPLNFSVGNLSTFHSVHFIDNQVCVSDCFNDRLFDLRMIGSSPIEVISPAELSSSFMKVKSSMSIERPTNCWEDLIFFSHDDEENEDDKEFYESADYGVADSKKSSRSCFLEQFIGALLMVGVH